VPFPRRCHLSERSPRRVVAYQWALSGGRQRAHPTAYYYLLAHPDFDDADLSSLTRCWVGGQTLPEAKAIEFTKRTGCPIHEVWGMTELAGAASANPVVGPNKPGTIGFAYPGNAIRVVDIDDPTVVLGPGERGEVDVRWPDGDGRLLR
jgi:long-chain acyl-CoA synthetase